VNSPFARLGDNDSWFDITSMSDRYRLVRRGNRYYAVDRESCGRVSLGTNDRGNAKKLLAAKNETARCPNLNLAIGRTYLAAHDPAIIDRTWSLVMDDFCRRGKEHTHQRRVRAMKSAPFQRLRDKKLVETTADDIRDVLRLGGSSTNHFMRCLHNLALGLGWLPAPIIPPKLWPVPQTKKRRGITQAEQETILGSERNEERRHYYELLWEIGASQSDAAGLKADNISWKHRVLRYQRLKTGECAALRIGPRLEQLLKKLPSSGYLFPRISQTTDSARSAEFNRRCRVAKVDGVSLHSYRYAWAERAKAAGYPVRWAQNALGHNSRVVHLAYATAITAICPTLEDYESKATSLRPLESLEEYPAIECESNERRCA
jgi:integrase